MKQCSGLRLFMFSAVDSSHPGGVQTLVDSLETGLKRRGHTVAHAWSEASGPRPKDRKVMRLHLRSLDEANGTGRTVHIPSMLRIFWALLRARPDIVHAHYLTFRIDYLLRLRRWFGYKLVVTAHGSDLLRPWQQERPFLPSILTNADRITSVSRDLAQAAQAIGGDRTAPIEIIRNGIDTEFFSPPAEPRAVEAQTVVNVGRLEPVKGQDILLSAFARVLDEYPDAKLLLIGDGGAKDELVRKAAFLGISDSVEFAGMLDREEIRDRLQASSLFVLPSRSEGTPVALIEALACGLNCIGTDVGGVPDVLADVGTVVPPEDVDALAMAMIGHYADPQAAQALRSRIRAEAERYSIDKSIDQYEALYRDLLRE
ncbi:glycosyltransferase [Croceicoccus marinus]|jgi:glycosyltransferase involved in cell wall biosynthesis|uniref:Glycosyltransferase n=1 Tax=Croceicoccus marinus TaxID=450378 RepID=A0A7G6VSZ9_9SPHN|nr:glycosyltransferase [Croceicoccus marinus]QNE04864.1 glycosyltransferase [Croceicoccus marinus]